jgi:transcription initiation factor TFIIIB Brf1 subunit/transcription initiation factor TFIIB
LAPSDLIWRYFFPREQLPYANKDVTVQKLHAILCKELYLQVQESDGSATFSPNETRVTCSDCQNSDPAKFVEDPQCADVICMKCGLVVEQQKLHEGAAFRVFEGEENRNHHGPAPNPLLSGAANLETVVPALVGADTAVREVARSYGKENADQRTTDGYKNRQKRQVFRIMSDCGASLRLPLYTVELAKQHFARLRDSQEKVQKLQQRIAACLVIAHEESAAW